MDYQPPPTLEQKSPDSHTYTKSDDPLVSPEKYASAESTHRDRRREKLQLSCTFCRRRKVRCDRKMPCNTCVNKGIALSCTYTPGPQLKATVSVGDRIQGLETLVRSLLQQQQGQIPQPPVKLPDDPSVELLTPSFGGTPGQSPPNTSLTSVEHETRPTNVLTVENVSPSISSAYATLPAPSENTSMRMNSHGANYVGSVHWAAVLSSISELKDHYEKEEETRMLTGGDHFSSHITGPRLLYEPVHATKADILASIPARPVVDRMVARYFNAQGVTPAVLHSGQFLREYENFWQDQYATPFSWIGLLFSIMCLSTQYQQLSEDIVDPDVLTRVHMFRERTVHCLVLSEFIRGGTHILETMVNHCATEVFFNRDAHTGPWILLGIIIQISLSQGYHRDPRNFSTISPFNGEMRRRVWAAIVQMDLRLSSQMGLPRLLKSHQCDTAEPRNLLDSDFDEATLELPASRPETDITPVLYGLAKNRIDSISGLISDLITGIKEHTYLEVMDLDRKLQEAEASLPPIFRWQPISQSFMVSPQIVLHRIYLQLAVKKLVIWLHRKYLAPSHAQSRYEYSRNACVEAAIKTLEFQQLLEEEKRLDGQLYSVRWMMKSTLLQSGFLLGMSILSYYLQLAKVMPDVPLDPVTGERIHRLLRNTYSIFLRSSTISRDAREAAEHLSLLPGLRGQQEGVPFPQEATDPLIMPQDANISFDQVTWKAYQECISSFPAEFGADFMTIDTPESPSAPNFSMIDTLLVNTDELGAGTT